MIKRRITKTGTELSQDDREKIESLAKAMGDRLKKFKEEQKLTIPQFSKLIGVGTDAGNKILSGESCLEYAKAKIKLDRIAAALKVTAADIYGETKAANGVSNERILEILAAVARLLGVHEEAGAAALAATLLEAVERPPIHREGVDDRVAKQIELEALVRGFLTRYHS